MAAANTDKLIKAARRFSTTIGAGGVADAVVTTVPLTSVTGLPTDTAVMIQIDRVDGSGNLTPSSEESVVGVISGSNIINCIRGVEGTAQAHSAGAVVEVRLLAAMWDKMVDWGLVDHGQLGRHKTLSDSNGNEWIKQSATSSAVNEVEIANAATGNGPQINVTGDDSNVDFEINPKGTGVLKAKTTVQLRSFGVGTDQSTGDGKTGFEVPSELDGFDLVAVRASVDTAGTTGTSDVQIRRVRSGSPVDMLSTKLTIDSTETSTSTAATAAVINTSNDDVLTGDMVYIDQDAVQTTPAKGGVISMTFAKP